MNNTKQQKLAAALLGALVGATVFLWVYGPAPLEVSRDGWILNGYDEWDVQQHYAGWLLFRNSHWTFPLGMADSIAAPDGTVISYTDSIPWVSILFKALRGVLPSTFQWFGWYVLLCFVLQGAVGALLTVRRTGLPFAVLGAGMFVCLPTLWERAFRHTALASQWIFLLALYAYLEYRTALRQGKDRFPWSFALLSFVSVGVHPYFLPLVMICVLAAAIDCGRITRRLPRAAAVFALPTASALAGGVLCGAIGGTGSLSRYGYGDFSMNLNALWNPSSRGGYIWSRLLPVQAQQSGQYDGFNYLGLGVLALSAAAVVLAAVRRSNVGDWWRRNGPLFGCCVFLTLFAVSNKIYYGTAGFEIPLPEWLAGLCGIFRSSGRMFYLPAACLLLFGLYTLWDALRDPRAAAAVLAVFVALQVWDLSAAAAEKRAVFEQETAVNVANAPETQGLGVGHTALIATPGLREDRQRKLAVLAGRQGLTTNITLAVDSSSPAAQQAGQDAAALLQSGQYDPAVVYVTTDGAEYESWQALFGENAAVSLFVVDSCYFLVPLGGI